MINLDLSVYWYYYYKNVVLKQSYRNALVHVDTCIIWALVKYCGGVYKFRCKSGCKIT